MTPSPVENPELLSMSKNELVSFCRDAGLSAHKGMTKEALARVLERTLEEEKDPVDFLREEVMDFIEKNREKIHLTCHGDCRLHSAAKVGQCHLILKGNAT